MDIIAVSLLRTYEFSQEKSLVPYEGIGRISSLGSACKINNQFALSCAHSETVKDTEQSS